MNDNRPRLYIRRVTAYRLEGDVTNATYGGQSYSGKAGDWVVSCNHHCGVEVMSNEEFTREYEVEPEPERIVGGHRVRPSFEPKLEVLSPVK